MEHIKHLNYQAIGKPLKAENTENEFREIMFIAKTHKRKGVNILAFFAILLFLSLIIAGQQIAHSITATGTNTDRVSLLDGNNALLEVEAKEVKVGVAAGRPVKLSIPAIGVNTDIEVVGRDSEGKMDVPELNKNAAWWKYGASPGDEGSSVIAGHFDNKDGSPSIFYNLDNLKEGDEIHVTDANGKTRAFLVYDSEVVYDRDFPLNKVFGESKGVNLNLITCAGSFDRLSKNYDKRLIVYSKLKI